MHLSIATEDKLPEKVKQALKCLDKSELGIGTDI